MCCMHVDEDAEDDLKANVKMREFSKFLQNVDLLGFSPHHKKFYVLKGENSVCVELRKNAFLTRGVRGQGS